MPVSRADAPADREWLVERLAELGGAGHFHMATGHRRARDPAQRGDWSPGMRRLHDVAPDAAVPTAPEYLARHVAAECRSGVQRAFAHALGHPDGEAPLDYAIVAAGGVRRLLRGAVRARGVGGAATLLGVVQDDTERPLRHREPLATAGRLATLTRYAVVGEMTSGLLHELNQPLTAIGNYAAAARNLAATPGVDPRLRVAVESIAAQNDRVAQVLRRLRELAGLQLGDVVATDLDALVADTLPLLQPLAHRLRAELRLRPGADLPRVLVDPVAIQLAVVNLACNALEATAAAGREPRLVELSTVRVPGGVQLCVADRGPGLPGPLQERVFRPFHSTKHGAAGLGLGITRTIADRHAGTVDVAPNETGGTTARLTLPLAGMRAGGA